MKLILGSWLLCILLTFEAQANLELRLSYRRPETSCTAVDLRSKLGPNRDQGEVGWCHANAAADLLSFEFAKELQGQALSSVFVALTNNYFQGSDADHESGWMNQALINTQVQGLCTTSLDEKIFRKGEPFRREVISELIDMKARFDATKAQSLRDDFVRIYGDRSHPMISLKPTRLFELLKNSTINSFPLMLATELCGSNYQKLNRKVPIREMRTEWWKGWRAPLVYKLHQVLDQDQIIGISYSMSLFESDTAPLNLSKTHASVIVGRRWNSESQSCEFLLRNSWGRDCSQYKAQSQKKPGACEHGNLWISEDKVETYAHSVTYFDHLKGLFK